MSRQLIARSPDLRRLEADGYSLRVVGGLLIVDDIPFVDTDAQVHDDGRLVMALTLRGDTTAQPGDHTAHFVGGVPCSKKGKPLAHIINNTTKQDLGGGLIAACYFSAKPRSNGRKYTDFHHKVVTYVGHIAGPASAIEPSATARRYRPVLPDADSQGPFEYIDTASSRAGIESLTQRLAGERVGIVGLGGSGEYLLDLVSKNPVLEIHTFDPDYLLTHNAFRGPGAPSLAELNGRPLKVDHYGAIYSNMHTGIVSHPYAVGPGNVSELEQLTFVFLAVDDADAKGPIIDALVEYGVPFIDVGMGVQFVDDHLTGLVRTTMVTPNCSDALGMIGTSSSTVDDEYRSNIQIAELNSLNASLAVLQWKRYRGIYADLNKAHHSLFSMASNKIVNSTMSAPQDDDADEATEDAA